MAARLEVYPRVDGRFDWHLVAANGDVLCGSDQGYRDRTDTYRAINGVIDFFCNRPAGEPFLIEDAESPSHDMMLDAPIERPRVPAPEDKLPLVKHMPTDADTAEDEGL
jgi:uncharacterized protein YegP (UPF0339 family)